MRRVLRLMRLPIRIDTPCGADFSEMAPVTARARLCKACDKVVHDLSGRSDAEVDALLADGPVCVRYLYDVHGRRLAEAPAGARIVPASALLSKIAQRSVAEPSTTRSPISAPRSGEAGRRPEGRVIKSRFVRAAVVAATAIVFEACGGNDGMRYRSVPTQQPIAPLESADAGADAMPTAK